MTPDQPALLNLGSTGRAVDFLQRRLGSVAASGVFDAPTDVALRAWQTAHALKPDGVYGPATCAAMVRAYPNDYQIAATRAGVSVKALTAIVNVEAAASGFFADGLPVIRLERHYVWGRANAAQRVQLDPSLCAPTQGGYAATSYGEWARFEQVAAVCGVEVAAASTSWGRGQIMGANYSLCDCTSATMFMLKAAQNEPQQLLLMAAFVGGVRGLVQAVNREDWQTVARLYNGPANVAVYSERLADAYAKL